MAKTTRDEIIEAARLLFRDKGYSGFSMGELADSVGLRKASLYSRFSGKDELAREALALTISELEGIGTYGANWLERYRTLLEGLADHLISARRCLGLHMLYGSPEGEIARANRDFFERLVGLCTAVLEERLPPDEAKALAEDSITALEGATLWLILNQDDAPMRRAVESIIYTASALEEPAERAAL